MSESPVGHDDDELSGEEAVALLKDFDFSKNHLGTPGPNGELVSTWLLTAGIVVKLIGYTCGSDAPPSEPFMMNFVASHTSIPVPKVRGVVSWDDSWWLFMDYIEGVDMSVAWPMLSAEARDDVAQTLHNYILQLRAINLPHPNTPGPINGTGKPLPCIGRYFTEDNAGPFPTYEEMSAWYAAKHRVAEAAFKLHQTADYPYTSSNLTFDASFPLVLTHADISLGNVVLGKDGKVWLIDWERCGAYPQWFEYSGIKAYEDHSNIPESWLQLAPVIAGDYSEQHQFLREIDIALTMYSHTEDPGPHY
ncbi:kinase-like protein [Leucogyrophana mollusca]|uniref:Kinase-like protein n=1 Tax=Leucogyrophana mollusca TaxID=85980 RepID=A0ACB8C1J3_9AGAM|nr:kinase-like protein [Leucogyrophana mollusca]